MATRMDVDLVDPVEASHHFAERARAVEMGEESHGSDTDTQEVMNERLRATSRSTTGLTPCLLVLWKENGERENRSDFGLYKWSNVEWRDEGAWQEGVRQGRGAPPIAHPSLACSLWHLRATAVDRPEIR